MRSCLRLACWRRSVASYWRLPLTAGEVRRILAISSSLLERNRSWGGKEMNGPLATIDRLVRATNTHDLEALTACFAEDYVNETPVHPARGFRGRVQVGRNWEQIFGFVPDIQAEVIRS